MAIEHEAQARHWIDVWNTRDLDRILTLYADDCTMASPKIIAAGVDPSGLVQGKDALRAYWEGALRLQPDLHFELLGIFSGPDSLVLYYRNQAGLEICEFLRFGSTGLIVQGAAHHAIGVHKN